MAICQVLTFRLQSGKLLHNFGFTLGQIHSLQGEYVKMGRIGTHNGEFHCDEALACFFLKSLPEFRNHEILRTRDSEVLDKCDIVVDVGSVYDHDKLRYDHHQRDFVMTMKALNLLDYTTKLSSAGLIYAHYGRKVIAALLQLDSDDPRIDQLYRSMYESFVECVDAIDNGIPQCDCIPRYKLNGTLSSRVSHLNPAWNEKDANPDERFLEAMKMVGEEFMSALNYLLKSWLPAKNIVLKAINERFEVFLFKQYILHFIGKIIVLRDSYCPWIQHLFELEKELGITGITYAIFPDRTSESWRVRAVPVDKNKMFENRLSLPVEWRSLRDNELSEVAKIRDCIFVHSSGFIGGNRSLQGALEMARKSLRSSN
uniref:UPF0160 protein MYG1, mitochondrial n=1 Tax=Syphacia muris TaxID=451379 RepID=A0A0N5AA10_9BILA